jgi:predicted DNA binding protein
VLPKDLPKSLKHLTDRELELLITAAVEEAKRRGRAPTIGNADEFIAMRSSRTEHTRQEQAMSLTRGQINAVRAAFKAGIKPSLIARQFGLSQSDVRKVLASDTTTRAGQR